MFVLLFVFKSVFVVFYRVFRTEPVLNPLPPTHHRRSPASSMYFSTEPAAFVSSDDNLAPAVELTFRDAGGNLATLASGTVTLSLFSGTGSLTGGGAVAVSSGVATFSALNVDLVGTKILQASTSAPYVRKRGVLERCVFCVSPFVPSFEVLTPHSSCDVTRRQPSPR